MRRENKMLILVVMATGGILGMILAGNKNRSKAWGLLCALLPISVLILLALPKVELTSKAG